MGKFKLLHCILVERQKGFGVSEASFCNRDQQRLVHAESSSRIDPSQAVYDVE